LEGARDVLPTVEVDTADEYLVACACEKEIARTLVEFGRTKKTPKVTVYAYEGPSINFGRPTNSIFFAVAGPERIVKALCASLKAVPGAAVRYGDYIPSERCTPRMHLEDGVVWVQDDRDDWESVDAPANAQATSDEPLRDRMERNTNGRPSDQQNLDFAVAFPVAEPTPTPQVPVYDDVREAISLEILPMLRARFAHYLRPEITSVRFGQEVDRCYLEIHTARRDNGRFDEAMTRTDLGFITNDDPHDWYFKPSRPLTENVRLLLEELGESTIHACTELFRTDAEIS
jgi:hypothetical protein